MSAAIREPAYPTRPRRRGGLCRVAFLAAIGVAGLVRLAPAAEADAPSGMQLERDLPVATQMSGREIYHRYLENRLRSLEEHLMLISSDPGGHEQVSELLLRWKDYRDENDRPTAGVTTKIAVRFLEPFDVRRIAYLVIGHEDRPDDQFIYLPSLDHVRRINLRGVGLMGTEYTIDDLIFQTLEDATYERLLDGQVGGIPAYVVRAQMSPGFQTRYPQVTIYADQAHYVPLRILFQDAAGEVAREYRSNAESIESFDGVWIATEATMTDLREETTTTLIVEDLTPNPGFKDSFFQPWRLDTGWE